MVLQFGMRAVYCKSMNIGRVTGHILTREELDSGFLKEELIDDDYVINIPVSFTFFFVVFVP